MDTTASRTVPQECSPTLEAPKRTSGRLPPSQTCPSLVHSRRFVSNDPASQDLPDWTFHEDSIPWPKPIPPEDLVDRMSNMSDKCLWPPARRPKTPLRAPSDQVDQGRTPTDNLTKCRLIGQSASSPGTSCDTAHTSHRDRESATTLDNFRASSSNAPSPRKDGSPRIAASTPQLSV